MNKKLSTAGIVILVAGVVMLLGSFLDFWSLDIPDELESFASGGASYNAWSSDLFFPVTLIPVLCGLAMAVHVGLTAFANVNLPDRMLGFTWNQIHLLLGFQAAVMMLAFLIQDNGPFDLGIGYWLMLLAAIGLAVGAVMRDREPASTS